MKATGTTMKRAARVVVALVGLLLLALPMAASHAAPATGAAVRQDRTYFEAQVVQGPDRGARLAGMLHLAQVGDGQLRGALYVLPTPQQPALTDRKVVPVTGVVEPLPGWPPLITKKLPPRQATTAWWLPAQPSTLASPNVPYTVWLPAGPLAAQLYGGAGAAAVLACAGINPASRPAVASTPAAAQDHARYDLMTASHLAPGPPSRQPLPGRSGS